MNTNVKINTPIGEGVSQGGFRTAQKQSNCLTPRAVKSGLWVFRASECGQGLIEYLMIILFVAFVIFVICRNWPW